MHVRYEACDDMPAGWTVICDQDATGLIIYFRADLPAHVLAEHLTRAVCAHVERHPGEGWQHPAAV